MAHVEDSSLMRFAFMTSVFAYMKSNPMGKDTNKVGLRDSAQNNANPRGRVHPHTVHEFPVIVRDMRKVVPIVCRAGCCPKTCVKHERAALFHFALAAESLESKLAEQLEYGPISSQAIHSVTNHVLGRIVGHDQQQS